MDKILLKKIQPDPNNPRQMFAADKMHALKESIKREGIISPLVVEKVGDNYILLDGERRFRAATELGLKEVPVVIEEARNATDRLIRQFTVQEQHEAWSPVEKAMALTRLADELGIGLYDVCRLLNISTTLARRYVAFSRLADKDSYIKSEIPMDFVTYLNSARNAARKYTMETLEQEFTKTDEKRLERKVIKNIKDGVIKNRSDISKLTYSFRTSPKVIEDYIKKEDVTPDSLFIKTGAKGAQALSNINFNAGYLVKYIEMYFKHPDVKVSTDVITHLREAHKAIGSFVSKFGS